MIFNIYLCISNSALSYGALSHSAVHYPTYIYVYPTDNYPTCICVYPTVHYSTYNCVYPTDQYSTYICVYHTDHYSTYICVYPAGNYSTYICVYPAGDYSTYICLYPTDHLIWKRTKVKFMPDYNKAPRVVFVLRFEGLCVFSHRIMAGCRESQSMLSWLPQYALQFPVYN